MRAISMVVSGETLAGLMMTALPTARADANFQAPSSSGKFQGVMPTTTPTGSRTTTPKLGGDTVLVCWPTCVVARLAAYSRL